MLPLPVVWGVEKRKLHKEEEGRKEGMSNRPAFNLFSLGWGIVQAILLQIFDLVRRAAVRRRYPSHSGLSNSYSYYFGKEIRMGALLLFWQEIL